MKVPSKRRKEEELRQEWTARLNRFAAAKTAKQRQAALEPALKINPGGALRGLLEAWGYSASSRGRKAKSEGTEPQRKPGREQLEAVLEELYGKVPSPVPNLNKKLAGTIPTTVKDACRIVAALVMSWPEATAPAAREGSIPDQKSKANGLADMFIRVLLSDLSRGRSHEWDPDEMEFRAFKLIDEERIGVSPFIKDAGETEGGLIVASAGNILLGTEPIDTIKQFYSLTDQFVGEGRKGILIFVFDAALFEAGERGFALLYNLGLLSMAMIAFALFDQPTEDTLPVRQHQVDWSRWRTLSRRCCAVIRKPTLIDPLTGGFLKHDKFDEFIANWRPHNDFAQLGELKGFVRFDSNHVLPRKYPVELSREENLSERELYWDVTVRASSDNANSQEVVYYTPPIHADFFANNFGTAQGEISKSRLSRPKRSGRPPKNLKLIEEDFFYVVKRDSPGSLYDDAQRAVYMAARGRLSLDKGPRHAENLNAAAALRQVGYEVLPISILLSLLPRSLHFATTHAGQKTTTAEK